MTARILNNELTPQARALIDAITPPPGAQPASQQAPYPVAYPQHPIAAAIQQLGQAAHTDDSLPTALRDALIDLPNQLCPDCGGDAWVWSRDGHGPDKQECPNLHCHGGIDTRGMQ